MGTSAATAGDDETGSEPTISQARNGDLQRRELAARENGFNLRANRRGRAKWQRQDQHDKERADHRFQRPRECRLRFVTAIAR